MSFSKNRPDLVGRYTQSKVNDQSGKLSKIIYDAEVISITDHEGLDRIKVRIKDGSMDNNLSDDALPYCYPFLDKSFFVKPKIGEGVKILLGDMDRPYNQRFYVSRLIPNFNNIDGLPYIFGTVASEKKLVKNSVNPEYIKNTEGLRPSDDEIGIYSKNNSSIILGNSTTEISAGKHLNKQPNNKNIVNPCKVKLFYKVNQDGTSESYNVIHSDYNMIISSKSEQKYNSDLDANTLKQILDNAQSIPYGEFLVEFLELMRTALINHVHPYHNVPPVSNIELIQSVKNFDLQKILSKNNKIS